MYSHLISISIDQPNCLVSCTVLQDLSHGEYRKAMRWVFAEVEGGFRYDWLFDLREIKKPLNAEDTVGLARTWADLARGRDVGRRTAIVSFDERLAAKIAEAKALFPYRIVEIFSDPAPASSWLAEISVDGQDHVLI